MKESDKKNSPQVESGLGDTILGCSIGILSLHLLGEEGAERTFHSKGFPI